MAKRVDFLDQEKGVLEIVLYDGEGDGTWIARRIEEALKAGKLVRWPDGREEWYSDEVIFHSDGEGSGRYEWDKSGNRVAYDRVLVTRKAGEIVGRKKVKKVYKDF